MYSTDYSTSPSITTVYIAINDYSFSTLKTPFILTANEYTWVKIDQKQQQILECKPNELPKWLKVIIVIRNLLLIVPLFCMGFAYNIIVNRKFAPYDSPQLEILKHYLRCLSDYKTDKKYPLAKIPIVESKSSPQGILILPQEILTLIFINSIAGSDIVRRDLSLVGKDFYHTANSSQVWNALANNIGFNFSQDLAAKFWQERAVYLNCREKMGTDFSTLISLFKDRKSVLALPIQRVISNYSFHNNLAFCVTDRLKKLDLFPLMKKEPIIRVVNNINGESCLLFKCISNIKNFEKNKEIWLVLSLKKLFPKTNYWISLVDLIEETHETIPAIYLDDFSNQLEIARNLLNGGTASFRFHYYDPTSPFKLSLEKSQKLNLI